MATRGSLDRSAKRLHLKATSPRPQRCSTPNTHTETTERLRFTPAGTGELFPPPISDVCTTDGAYSRPPPRTTGVPFSFNLSPVRTFKAHLLQAYMQVIT